MIFTDLHRRPNLRNLKRHAYEIDHLPDRKKRELEHIVRVLFEEFEDALAGRNAPHRKPDASSRLSCSVPMPGATGSTIPSVAISPTMICLSSSITTSSLTSRNIGRRRRNIWCATMS
ncbi:hypothetical protein DdX_21818 [Ditylenchus destructor]|uniref:Uncharacterized protein n=1 Tax=Ditylenchus destructor TaxID=166010 RepID=A0AAD4MF48_9BILA|nr:hypothetical protein DdX_21818 [Ditylenchus destructor]